MSVSLFKMLNFSKLSYKNSIFLYSLKDKPLYDSCGRINKSDPISFADTKVLPFIDSAQITQLAELRAALRYKYMDN